jgi:hypothetical protein
VSYLEMALKVSRVRQSAERPEPENRAVSVPGVREATCAASCYEVEPGVRIHPPKSSEEWKEWLLKWEPKGRVQ